MTVRREPSTPPRIPGYSHSRLLGTGGFADVFLYQQQMPRRLVAVKVLLASALGDDVRARFRAEADLMARLSHHPSIVTIYQADVAPDGRPYLVMEYCSRPGLGRRYRGERMAVAEVLRIGVRLAGAVETAHRAGVLHRDIKPANVLVTDFGWPALTDFGIAATTWSSRAAVGMSIPWSPPELLTDEPVGDERADVYSLAATIYSLLARRSPFEVPDGPNSAADLLARIERLPLGPTGRGDVPASLQAVLVRAMEKDPARRYPSALALARALQQVEAELLLPLTPLDLPEEIAGDVRPAGDDPVSLDHLGRPVPVDDQPTRLRPVLSVHPDAGPAGAGAGGSAGSAVTVGAASTGPITLTTDHADVPAQWRDQARALESAASSPEPAGRVGGRARLIGAVLAGAGLAAVLVVAGVLALREPAAPLPSEVEAPPGPTATLPGVRAVPAPQDLVGVLDGDGSARFTWVNPDPQEGDEFLWGPVVPGAETVLDVVAEPAVTVPAPVAGAGDDRVCIEVSVVRADGRYSTTPAVGCATP